jgi:hypothetical protein
MHIRAFAKAPGVYPMADEKKQDEVEDKASQKVASYLATEHGVTLELAKDATDSAKKLCEALSSFSANQYFSQKTAKKWFELAITAEGLKCRAEAANARLAAIAAGVEVSVLRKEKPKADAAKVKAVFSELEKVLEELAKANDKAQELLQELSEDVKSR